MKALVAMIALALVVAGCDAAGRSCTHTSECGDAMTWACAYPLGDCTPGLRGTCTRLTDCFGPEDMGSSGTLDPSNEGCTCEGTMGGVYGHCAYQPTISIGVVACWCDGAFAPLVPLDVPAYSSESLHAGPRATTELCHPRNHSVMRSQCCDCSLAVVGAATCETSTYRLPDACCVCVSATSPDPTGRCAPPGGVFPSGQTTWCCPITEDPDAGAPPDAGT